MTTSISPQMRIIAVVGVLLIALAGSALVLMPRAKSGALSAPSTPIVTTPHVTGSHPTTPAPTKVVQPTVDPQLPVKLRVALAQHSVVVVGTYDPEVQENQLVLDEVRRGALAARAGFLAVNLLDDEVAGLLTGKLSSGELLPVPGVLIYRRPGKVVFRFDGYLDRAAIEQAALNSK